MELIGKKEVIYAIVNTPSKPDFNKMPNRTTFRIGSAFRQQEIIDIISNLPSIDTNEVVYPLRPKGKWIGIWYDGYADMNPVYDVWECSICGHEIKTEDAPPYCEMCGADMRGK